MAEIVSKIYTTLRGHKSAILALEFNSDGQYCLSGGQDRTIILWNPHKGTKIKEYSGAHGHEILGICISIDKSRFVSCGGDRVVFIWDVATGKIMSRLRNHNSRINCVKYNQECTVLFSASYDQTIMAWDMRAHNREPIQILRGFQDSVTSMAITSHQILGGSVDGTLRHFDLRMGNIITDHVAHPVTSVSMSNDGQCVLLSCLDNSIRLFENSSGELLNEYKGHVNNQLKIDSCLTYNDSHVVSGSEDNNIYYWDLVESSKVTKLKGHTGVVTCLSYHPSNHFLLSGSTDNTIIVWK